MHFYLRGNVDLGCMIRVHLDPITITSTTPATIMMTLVIIVVAVINNIIAIVPQPHTPNIFPLSRSRPPRRDPGLVAGPSPIRAIIAIDQSVRVVSFVCDLSSAAPHAPPAARRYVEEWDAAIYLVDDGLHDDERAGDEGDVDFRLCEG